MAAQHNEKGDWRVTVIGACNTDLISYVPHLPRLGETLKGHSFKKGFGGKGANQAVMAARIGAQVSMIGKVGLDSYGRETKDNFQQNKVDTTHLFTVNPDKEEERDVSSGLAPIAVDDKGNNSIIIIGGANDLLSKEEVHQCRQTIAQSKYLLCQLELPLEITLEAMRLAQEERSKGHSQVQVIFNPAPAQTNLPAELYALADIVCPNETELEILSGKKVTSPEDATEASKVLLERGVKAVLVTLGSKGCLLVTKDGTHHCPGEENIKVVDTTGAGDCFLGSLAYFLCAGHDLPSAMKKANYVAAQSVTKHGTQTSYPHRNELPQELFQR